MIDITTPIAFHTTMNSLSLEGRTSAKFDVTRMSRDINHDPTHTPTPDAETIQLKRAKNSLLSIARIPPEILGHIFRFNIAGVGDPHFPEIPKGSYNFLLVCHHWFRVALRTPELWTSWGNSLKDWKRWHLRSGISALDLILDGWKYGGSDFDEALQEALRDRAARDVIRKVHLDDPNTELLTAIISSLIPEGEDVRPSSIESIVLNNVNVSDLFARRHFPKLRNLHLSGRFRISSWDHLKSTTTTLTNLSINFSGTNRSSAVPTTSQVFSLLASNPNLLSLTLITLPINDDGGGAPGTQLPLRYLERILLSGTFHHVFPILQRLEFPERMDHGEITLHDCTPQEVLEVIGPYIRDYLRRDPRFRDRLEIFLRSDAYGISVRASAAEVGHRGPDRLPQSGPPYARFSARLSQPIPPDVRKKLYIDVLALLPQESIVNFYMDLPVAAEVVVAMPNLQVLRLVNPVVSDGFLLPNPNGPNAHKKLFPSLQRLYLEDAEAVEDNWEPLVTYLVHQTSGDQAVSLGLFDEGVHICSEVIERIEGLVEEFVYDLVQSQGCGRLICDRGRRDRRSD